MKKILFGTVMALAMFITTQVNAAPIHEHTQNNNWNGVKAEIDNGYDVNEKDEHGQAALLIAAGLGHGQIVDLLLSCPDIDVDVATEWGGTPLMAACSHGKKDIVLKLLKKNPNVYARIQTGQNALMYAEATKHMDIYRIVEEYMTQMNGMKTKSAANRAS